MVTDGLALIEAVEGVKLDPEQADAIGLLGVVTGQDVEPDPDREGRWRIARRVARGSDHIDSRPRSQARSQDPDQQTGRVQGPFRRRTRNRLVTAVTLTAANTPDADSIKDLVAEEPPGAEIVADSAYASGAALETFDGLGHTPVVKPIVRKPHIEDGFHRDDF